MDFTLYLEHRFNGTLGMLIFAMRQTTAQNTLISERS